jgi:hypothetical protein
MSSMNDGARSVTNAIASFPHRAGTELQASFYDLAIIEMVFCELPNPSLKP